MWHVIARRYLTSKDNPCTIIVTEPATPLNNAYQGGAFFYAVLMDGERSMVKSPTTYEEQIDILRQRGLGISDTDKAVEILTQVNYYRLSAYMLSLKIGDRFIDGTTIQTVYALYEFDRKLRNLIMSGLETIEIAFRTHIAYTLAHNYGSLGYLDDSYFFNKVYHQEFIKHFHTELARADELFVRHHRMKYSGQFPIWVAVEVLSFSTLSKLYANLKNDDKSKIAKEYYGIPHVYISNWLHVLSIIRNICAHYGRLYGRRLTKTPRLSGKDSGLGIETDRVFAAIFMMKNSIATKTHGGALSQI